MALEPSRLGVVVTCRRGARLNAKRWTAILTSKEEHWAGGQVS